MATLTLRCDEALGYVRGVHLMIPLPFWPKTTPPRRRGEQEQTDGLVRIPANAHPVGT